MCDALLFFGQGLLFAIELVDTGDVGVHQILAELIFANYRQASSDWGNGLIDLAGFRRRALLGVYLYFLSDAAESFRPTLLARIAALG